MVTPASPGTPTAMSEASDASSAQRRRLRTPALTAPANAAAQPPGPDDPASQSGPPGDTSPAREALATELEAALGLPPSAETEQPSRGRLASVTAGSRAPAGAQSSPPDLTSAQHRSSREAAGSPGPEREQAPRPAARSGIRQSREPTYSVATVTPREGGASTEVSGFNISSGQVTIKTRSAVGNAPVSAASSDANQLDERASRLAPPTAGPAQQRPAPAEASLAGRRHSEVPPPPPAAGENIARVVVPLRSTESPCPEAEPPLQAEPIQPASRPPPPPLAPAAHADADPPVPVSSATHSAGGSSRPTGHRPASARLSAEAPGTEAEATARRPSDGAGGGDDDEALSPVSPRFRAPTVSSSIRRERAIEARVRAQLQPAAGRTAAGGDALSGRAGRSADPAFSERGTAAGSVAASGRGSVADGASARPSRAHSAVGADQAPTAYIGGDR